MEIFELEQEVKSKLTKVKQLIGLTISLEQKDNFTNAIMTDAAFEAYKKHKLNEEYYFSNFRGNETVGDAVLALLVCDEPQNRYLNRQDMTEPRKKAVNNTELQKKCHFMKEFMIEVNVAKTDKKKYAKAIERLIGAIYRAYGIEVAQKFIKEKGIL